ncbi:MAG: alpha/beta hydrolase [Rhodoferax sp.]|nr:alpha/beta hydrolase [Rhodoferax sp.]
MKPPPAPSAPSATSLRIALPGGDSLSGLLEAPADAHACYVFAHGAGAGMAHEFMMSMAASLAARRVATLRFQFPFIEKGSKRPDAPKVAHAAVRAAVSQAAEAMQGVPLFAGGKSFGARMTSQAQAIDPLPHVRGLVFVGFPLHPSGKPSVARAAHLGDVRIPMLFVQGTRDALADLPLLRQTTTALGHGATLHTVDGADHGFHVLVRSGRTEDQVREVVCDRITNWMQSVV